MFAKPSIDGNARLAAGGMAFEVLEPFHRLRLSYEGEVLLLDQPHDMAEPGRAFRTSPRVPCSIMLEVTGVAPMHGGELINLDGLPLKLDLETAVFRGHTEQHVAARGAISVADETFDIDGFGYRDKSWGPRHWQSFYWYKWLPVTFGAKFGVVLQIMGRPDALPFINGAVFTDGRLVPILEAEVRAIYDEHDYQPPL